MYFFPFVRSCSIKCNYYAIVHVLQKNTKFPKTTQIFDISKKEIACVKHDYSLNGVLVEIRN